MLIYSSKASIYFNNNIRENDDINQNNNENWSTYVRQEIENAD